jgi:hypothetical protein
MAERDPPPLLRRLRINPPGRDGGIVELIHALAVIVARLEREERERPPLEPAPERPPHA